MDELLTGVLLALPFPLGVLLVSRAARALRRALWAARARSRRAELVGSWEQCLRLPAVGSMEDRQARVLARLEGRS